ncbi:MAG: phosphoglucosamine mutase, partial [Bacteroidia bacterium]
VSNMSSSRALRDITLKWGGKWYHSPVGEVNVVEAMKRVDAVIGGEGNGGVIYPPLHYGRDALVGIALFLTLLAKKRIKCSELRKTYPDYVISKNRVDIDEGSDPERIIAAIEKSLGNEITDRRDGILVENEQGWVQVRKSNTESILRIYSEGRSEEEANLLAERIIKIVKKVTSGQK